MKYLLLLLLMPVFSSAQKSEVIEDSTIKKADAFSKSLLWIATTWKSANNVVQMKDQDAGIIVVKGYLSSVAKQVGVTLRGGTSTQLTIQIKDGKAKIAFDKTFWEYNNSSSFSYDEKGAFGKNNWERWKENVDKEMSEMIADYKKALLKSSDF